MRLSAILVATMVMSCCFVADLKADPAAPVIIDDTVQVTDAAVTDGAVLETGCCDESQSSATGGCCSCRGHRWFGCYQSHLPCAWRSTRDMYQHTPYRAEPEDYYYFRPYNHMHIAQQQAEVQNYGLDARNPYANDFFQEVYKEVEAEISNQADAPSRRP